MKTHMEEVEDDLAAEEENKLINEVRCPHLHLVLSRISKLFTFIGIQNLV